MNRAIFGKILSYQNKLKVDSVKNVGRQSIPLSAHY